MSVKGVIAGAAICAMLALFAALSNGSQAAIGTPECIGTAFKAKTETAEYIIDVNAAQYATVPGTAVPFTQGAPGCIVLMFSAVAAATSNQIKLRAVIDGGTYVAELAHIGLTAFEDSYDSARSFNFVFKGIPAGAHTAAVQAFPSFGDGSAKLRERSTIVFYRR
jgi:hypothetical protein